METPFLPLTSREECIVKSFLLPSAINNFERSKMVQDPSMVIHT